MPIPLSATSVDKVLAIDDTGVRKDGGATDHVVRQYLGSVRTIDNRIVTAITLWAHEPRGYPLRIKARYNQDAPYWQSAARSARQ